MAKVIILMNGIGITNRVALVNWDNIITTPDWVHIKHYVEHVSVFVCKLRDDIGVVSVEVNSFMMINLDVAPASSCTFTKRKICYILISCYYSGILGDRENAVRIITLMNVNKVGD